MKRLFQIIISIVYIIWGIGAPLSLIGNLLKLNIAALTDLATLIAIATGLVMLFAGIFGLLRIKPLKRRLLGIFIFVLALAGVVTSVIGGGFSWQALLQALMAWAYIVW